MKFKTKLSFDDVLLVPQKSSIESRKQVNITTNIGNRNFCLPIISSPMDTVTEHKMALSVAWSGGFGIVHRYNSISQQADHIRKITDKDTEGDFPVAAAVGVSSDFVERSSALVDAGAFLICIDVAHGHHTNVERAIKTLKDKYSDSISIMAGNVATKEAFYDLQSWGADAIRVGVGGGSICSTRIHTAHGVPTFSSVLDCQSVADSAVIVADGGIKNAGDIVKCLAAGADFVMLGSLLAGTDESPGDILVDSNGIKTKTYRGMASVEAQVQWRGQARSLEGVATTVPYKGKVSNILSDLAQNIRSGLSYSGARSISEFRNKAKFIMQTPSGLTESRTHILLK